MYQKPLLAGLLTAAMLPAASAPHYEFDFWPLDGAERDPRFVQKREGACGAVVVARVRSMPQKNDKALESEVVFELSRTSRILRSWRIPVNTSPAAVEGSSLVFLSGERTYKTTTGGTIAETKPLAPMTEISEVTCKMPKAFEGSAYARCWSVARIGGQSRAILAHQAPCT